MKIQLYIENKEMFPNFPLKLTPTPTEQIDADDETLFDVCGQIVVSPVIVCLLERERRQGGGYELVDT